MIRFFILALFFCLSPSEGNARAVKLGDMSRQNPTIGSRNSNNLSASSVSCLENTDCPYNQECVTLQCEDVCKADSCSAGTHCIVWVKEPHKPQCVQCVTKYHCDEGMYCEQKTHTCQKLDPCVNAVCSPAAPFCMPKPYKTLPYTCVQCLEDLHCPPVAGLTRSCVDGYCLFNVEGNVPAQKQTSASDGAHSILSGLPAPSEPSAPAIRKIHQVEIAQPPARPPVVPHSVETVQEESDDEYEEEEEYYEDEDVVDED